jgi:hypothetical protein
VQLLIELPIADRQTVTECRAQARTDGKQQRVVLELRSTLGVNDRAVAIQSLELNASGINSAPMSRAISSSTYVLARL